MKDLHPGHKILRRLEPEADFRRSLVSTLIYEASRADRMDESGIADKALHRVLASHGIHNTTPEDRDQIREFINAI